MAASQVRGAAQLQPLGGARLRAQLALGAPRHADGAATLGPETRSPYVQIKLLLLVGKIKLANSTCLCEVMHY